jgi:hypothetical protein
MGHRSKGTVRLWERGFIGQRLATLAWAVHVADENGMQELRRLIEKQGGSWAEHWSEEVTTKDGTVLPSKLEQIVVCGPSGVTCGLVPGMDPVAAYVQASFALIGQLWALVPDVRDGLKLINQLWSEETAGKKDRD